MSLAVPALAAAQLLGSPTSPVPTERLPTLTTIVDGAGNIVIGNTLVSPDEEATKEEPPGLELLGVMMRDTDFENSAGNSGGSGGGVGGNETISLRRSSHLPRRLAPHRVAGGRRRRWARRLCREWTRRSPVKLHRKWITEDLTDDLPRWEITNASGGSCWFDPLGCGKPYYDLVTLENRTLEIWQDTVKK